MRTKWSSTKKSQRVKLRIDLVSESVYFHCSKIVTLSLSTSRHDTHASTTSNKTPLSILLLHFFLSSLPSSLSSVSSHEAARASLDDVVFLCHGSETSPSAQGAGIQTRHSSFFKGPSHRTLEGAHFFFVELNFSLLCFSISFIIASFNYARFRIFVFGLVISITSVFSVYLIHTFYFSWFVTWEIELSFNV